MMAVPILKEHLAQKESANWYNKALYSNDCIKDYTVMTVQSTL